MFILQYIEELKKIHTKVIQFIDNESNTEENYQNLCTVLNNFKIQENKHDLKLLLYLISTIADNHYRTPNFFKKIERILLLFKDAIKTYYSKSEIFFIFKRNKRILLFLLKNNIIKMTKKISKILLGYDYKQQKYVEYFYPEIKPFIEELIEDYDKELYNSEIFYKNRIEGENNNIICKLIRNDSLEDFVDYIHEKSIPLDYTIEISLYETHPFLLSTNKIITLIDYASFFGATKIFKYLRQNDTEYSEYLYFYLIHGNNQELLNFMEDIEFDEVSHTDLLKESIKCHHIDIANYFKNTFDYEEEIEFIYDDNFDHNFLCYIFQYYYFSFFPNDFGNKIIFFYLCEFDYFSLAEMLLKIKKISVCNEIIGTFKTPLYLACEKNNCDLYNFLLLLPEIQNKLPTLQFCGYLKEIKIPSSIKRINSRAFYYCTSLKKVQIPSSVTSIGKDAFMNCSSLKKIFIPLSVTEISENAFRKCSSLTKISIPSSVKRIEKSTFSHCISLIEIDIPDSIISIGEFAFNKCTSLKKIVIPDSVRSIGQYAFNECSSLNDVSISNMINSIEKCTFTSCTSLEIIYIPKSILSINEEAFKNCTSLKKINMHHSLESIGEYAFYGCTELTSIYIPSSVTSIGVYAFEKCSSLSKISIPPFLDYQNIGLDFDVEITSLRRKHKHYIKK